MGQCTSIEELLDKVSLYSSYGKSLNKVRLSEDVLNLVLLDSHRYNSLLLSNAELSKYQYRVKSVDSCIRKYKKAF